MILKLETSKGKLELNEPSYGQVEEALESKSDKEIINLIEGLRKDEKVNIRELPYSEVRKLITNFFMLLNQADQ
jgi:hypothetical protein